MKLKNYYDLIVEEIIADLTANLRIKRITNNSSLIGSFAEESVIELIKKIVFPLRTCSGSVIDIPLLTEFDDLPQLDCIIWNPTPFPGLFQKGNFGIIPKQSVCGILEIKSSNYSGVGSAIQRVLSIDSLLVAKSPPRLSQDNLVYESDPLSLGIICLYDRTKKDKVLTDLIEKNLVSIILEHDGDLNLEPSRAGVLNLVNFLKTVRNRAALKDGKMGLAIKDIENS